MSDLVKRLRDTPNWMREGFQDWKDNMRTYDRAPFEAADRIEELETLIKDFFTLLDKTEETDEGRVFRPNRISSCRAEDGQKLENLLRLLKATVEGRW